MTNVYSNIQSVKTIAIVLAGGRGNRMNSDIPKQYMEVGGKPILYYSLKAFEDSFVDEIILVVGENDLEYCKKNIVDKFALKKISRVVVGGKERYNSVYNGLKAIADSSRVIEPATNREKIMETGMGRDCYIFIHDGARPCLTEDILNRCLETVKSTKACVAAMPVKDTIKIVDSSGYAISTPDRKTLWQIQTPQVFSYNIIKRAYDELINSGITIGITDDAMVVEQFGNTPVKVIEGSYDNIKVTTPNDIEILKAYYKTQI